MTFVAGAVIEPGTFRTQRFYDSSSGVRGGLCNPSYWTVEFEDGLRTGVLHGGCWCPCGGCIYPRINSASPGVCRLVLGWVWLS